MKKYIIIVFNLLLSLTIWSQVISVPAGASFHVPENVNLILSGPIDFNVDSENTTFEGNVKFISSEEQIISGTMPLEIANLYVNNNGLILDNNLFVSSELDMQHGIINLQSNNLTVGDVLQGNVFDNTTMIVKNESGTFQRNITENGTYLFPIGDIDGNEEYSPVEIEMLSGTYTDANISVSVTNSKHSDNSSTTTYLNRYWDITSSGITSPEYDVNLTYLPADVVGNESEMYGAYYSSEWNLLDLVSGNQIIAAGLNEFGSYTGGEQSAFVVGIDDIQNNDIDIFGLEDGIKINTNSNIEIYKVEVFNVLGQKIHSQKNLNSHIVNFSNNVQTAVYFVRIHTNKGVTLEKVLVY